MTAVIASLAVTAAAAPAHAATPTLQAGVGRADIEPATGYFLGGWTRADRLGLGQSTRLRASALILKRGNTKVALVAADLFAIPGGLQQDVAKMVADRGFTESNILLGASHTHSGPGGFANAPTYNTAAPSVNTITDPFSYVRLFQPAPADPQLYTFLVQRIALAIRRADLDVAPAVAGWGHTRLVGLTQNRSIEAFLENYGIDEPLGKGRADQDPKGYADTIDPAVDVLRVDRVLKGGKRRPIGAWSNFANHGTVVHSEFQAYTGDHHATATRTLEAAIRKAGHVPASQPVIDVYGNSNEGDQTAGIQHVGPAAANEVGRVEAGKMLSAWRQAGSHLSSRPSLGLRWTRICFCGQAIDGGHVAKKGIAGIPFLTGSEEGRGPLYDITHVPLEGYRAPTNDPEQGDKDQAPLGDFPQAAPIMVVRVGDGAIAAVPGEATKQVGANIKAAILDGTRGSGIHSVVIGGLANEYLSYITTSAEYSWQSYEGGSTMFGPFESDVIRDGLADLAIRLVKGQAAPAPYAFDESYGVHPSANVAYGDGAATGVITAQPSARYGRLEHPKIAWKGGVKGLDRPLDTAFVVAERKVGRGWKRFDDDLGLNMVWRVDASGGYTAEWEVPLTAPTGTYRLRVTAKRYHLTFNPFRVGVSAALPVTPVPAGAGRVAVKLGYPAAVVDVDLTYRPPTVSGGSVRFLVAGRPVLVKRRAGGVFSVPAPAGAPVTVPAGAARDRFGNRNPTAVTVR
jgi:hypothetical protein